MTLEDLSCACLFYIKGDQLFIYQILTFNKSKYQAYVHEYLTDQTFITCSTDWIIISALQAILLLWLLLLIMQSDYWEEIYVVHIIRHKLPSVLV